MAATTLLLSCQGAPAEKSAPPKPPIDIEPLDPPASAFAPVSPAPPAWLTSLPKVTVTVKPGEKVWATLPIPGSEMAEPGLFTLESTYNAEASLTSQAHQRIDRVPGALIHRVKTAGVMHQGARALIFIPSAPASIARIKRHRPGQPIRVTLDQSGKTGESDVHHAEPERLGIQVFAYVGFPLAGAVAKGLLIALSADAAWIYTASGHVERRARTAIQTLNFGTGRFAAQEAVRAYRYSQGFQPGTVSRVLEPGLRYRISFGSEQTKQDFFFSDLISKP